jgi:hypothetical protein
MEQGGGEWNREADKKKGREFWARVKHPHPPTHTGKQTEERKKKNIHHHPRQPSSEHEPAPLHEHGIELHLAKVLLRTFEIHDNTQRRTHCGRDISRSPFMFIAHRSSFQGGGVEGGRR